MVRSISLELAKFVAGLTYAALPETARQTARLALTDALGVMLAATSLEPACGAFARIAETFEPGMCTVLGSRGKATAAMAAMSNGALAHALDFEDAHEGSLMHPNAANIPAALAIAEALGGVTGEEFVVALTAGSEVVCRLGLALGTDPLKLGWYIPPIAGAFGATATVARILKLDARQTLHAFGFCLYQATCSKEFLRDGDSVMRAVRDGFAARTGVLSALLARENLVSVKEPFEGPGGFFAMYSAGRYDEELLTGGLGQDFESSRLSFKAWPSCRGTHPYIQAALTLRERRVGDVESIESIVVDVGAESVTAALVEPLERKQRPTAGIDAKFSIPFCVAVALVRGKVDLSSFTASGLSDEAVLACARKVRVNLLPVNDARRQSLCGAVHLVDGNGEDSEWVDTIYGSPELPLGEEQLRLKFFVCAGFAEPGLEDGEMAELFERAMRVDQFGEMRELLRGIYGTV